MISGRRYRIAAGNSDYGFKLKTYSFITPDMLRRGLVAIGGSDSQRFTAAIKHRKGSHPSLAALLVDIVINRRQLLTTEELYPNDILHRNRATLAAPCCAAIPVCFLAPGG